LVFFNFDALLQLPNHGKAKKNFKPKRLSSKFIYMIKIKGKTKIPDYVQIRDEEYTLLAYCRADRPEKALIKLGFENQLDELKSFLDTIPFGKMFKYKF
jgi:hypothetical protein